MRFVHSDGGRTLAGFRGPAGDCVTRAIAIATQLPYRLVYNDLTKLQGRTAREGIGRKAYETYLRSLGWTWHATMGIGTGCRVHLRAEELPPGRLICRLSKHVVAVIDGVLYDTYDSSRDGTRCVYGYFFNPKENV